MGGKINDLVNKIDIEEEFRALYGKKKIKIRKKQTDEKLSTEITVKNRLFNRKTLYLNHKTMPVY